MFLPSYSWSTITLARVGVTCIVMRADGVTITRLTTFATLQVVVTILAFVTILSNYMWFTIAGACCLITIW